MISQSKMDEKTRKASSSQVAFLAFIVRIKNKTALEVMREFIEEVRLNGNHNDISKKLKTSKKKSKLR